MAVAWRITSCVLLLVASFHLATIAQAQTDNSFSRWLEARERLEREAAKAEAAERCISVEAALSEVLISRRVVSDSDRLLEPPWLQVYSDLTPAEKRSFPYLRNRGQLYRDLTPSQQRLSDLYQFWNDEAEAAERGISVKAVLAERLVAGAEHYT